MQHWGLTDPGCVRAQNQDAYQLEQLDKSTLLCVVCDGMGGAKSGNIASSLAVDVFVQEVDGNHIVVIHVPRAERSYKPVYVDGNPLFTYRRNGEGDYRCTKEEIQAMLSEIQALQSELMQREDALFKAERDLQEKQNQLELQNAKITELTALIEQQNANMQDIKNKIQNALVGYEGNGLQIESRNGRIYVSLDEKLLFQSGKWNVDARGKKAIL